MSEISNEKYLDTFLNVLVDMMIKNGYENLNLDQIMVLRNNMRLWSYEDIKKLGDQKI